MADENQQPGPSEDPRNLDALSASQAPGVIDALDRNRNKILLAIGTAAVVFCGILVSSQIQKQKHLEAAAAFTSAAIKGEVAALDAVVVDFPGSIAAGNALLTKAELQNDQGKSEDARKTLETFIADFSKHPRHAQGVFALANLFHLAGDRDQAKANYEKVIAEQPDGELTPLARIRLGDLALEAGDAKAADQRYQESFTLHPGNPFVDYANEKIALLKVGNPTEVEKPAPPAPPAPPAETKPESKPAEAKPAPPALSAPAAAPKSAQPAPAPKAETPAPAPKTEAPAPAPKVQTPAPVPKTEAPSPAPKVQTPAPAPKTDAPAPAQ